MPTSTPSTTTSVSVVIGHAVQITSPFPWVTGVLVPLVSIGGAGLIAWWVLKRQLYAARREAARERSNDRRLADLQRQADKEHAVLERRMARATKLYEMLAEADWELKLGYMQSRETRNAATDLITIRIGTMGLLGASLEAAIAVVLAATNIPAPVRRPTEEDGLSEQEFSDQMAQYDTVADQRFEALRRMLRDATGLVYRVLTEDSSSGIKVTEDGPTVLAMMMSPPRV